MLPQWLKGTASAAALLAWLFIAGLMSGLACRGAFGAETILTEGDVLALFYSRNLELLSATFDLETARAEKIVAAAIPNPELKLYSQEIAPRYPEPQIGPAIYVTVEQLIETAGKRRLRTESSGLGAEAAESDLRDTARVLSQTVRRAHYGLLFAQKKVEATLGQLEHVNALGDANQQRFDAGDISERDLARIRVEASKVHSEFDQAGAELARARAQLAVMLAWPDKSESLSAADRWPSADTFSHLKDARTAAAAALERRPDIQAAKLRQQQARKEFELAKAQAIPNVSLSAGFGHDWGNIVTNAATLGLSVPLPLFYRNEGQIAQAGFHTNDAEVVVRRNENTARGEVASAVAAWQAADAVVRRFETEILKRAKYIRDSAEYAYAQGGTDIVDLIQAQRDFRAALFDYFQAHASRAFAYADLKMALGEENSDLRVAPEVSP